MAYLAILDAQARITSARAGLEFAQESLRLAQGRYAAGAGPILEVVDAQTTVQGKSLALDKAGRPHVAYEALSAFKTHELRYTYRTRTGWGVQVVDSTGATDAGFEPSLALDQTGAARISYGAFDSLKFARWTGSDWVRERVDRSPARFTSLALDAADKPLIGYLIGNDLKLARRPGLNWQLLVVDTRRSTGAYTSLAADRAGGVHIAYRDISTGVLRYAVNSGTAWQSRAVDAGAGPAAHTALAVDQAGAPHLLYVSSPGLGRPAALRYARWTGSIWVIETIAPDIGLADRFESRRPGLQIDAAGMPHVAYYDGTAQAIIYGRFDGGRWQLGPVAGGGAIGECVSLALDGQAAPSVLYHAGDRGELILAQRGAEGWQESVVDAGFYVSGCNGLVLDGAGHPHVCYSALSGQTVDLRYARRVGEVWQVNTVQAGAPFTGDFCAIALDAGEQPHISFYDATEGDLLHAWRTGEAWQVEAVARRGDVGAYSALAVAAEDTLYISYHDGTTLDLKVAVEGEPVPPATPTPTVTPTPTATATATATATTTTPAIAAAATSSPTRAECFRCAPSCLAAIPAARVIIT